MFYSNLYLFSAMDFCSWIKRHGNPYSFFLWDRIFSSFLLLQQRKRFVSNATFRVTRCTRPSFEFLPPGDFGARGLNTETPKSEVEASAVKGRQPPQCHMPRTLRRVVKVWHAFRHNRFSEKVQVYAQPPCLYFRLIVISIYRSRAYYLASHPQNTKS